MIPGFGRSDVVIICPDHICIIIMFPLIKMTDQIRRNRCFLAAHNSASYCEEGGLPVTVAGMAPSKAAPQQHSLTPSNSSQFQLD